MGIKEILSEKNLVITGYLRGHEVESDDGEIWVFSDTKESTEKTYKSRPCKLCGELPSNEGHDYCIRNLPGVIYACCGHGTEKGYIAFEDGRVIRGKFKVDDEKLIIE